MSADFWSGYVSGAVGILVGNPLDLIKTRVQAGTAGHHPQSIVHSDTASGASSTRVGVAKPFDTWTSLARGAAAPILGYGALNALLFVTYNRSLALLNTGKWDAEWSETPSAWSLWTAGALGGLAIWFVSAPTELVKCRAQVASPPRSSLEVTKELWKQRGVRGLYLGGTVTSLRDSIGYGFYFWSYQLSKQAMIVEDESQHRRAIKVLLCGGMAGIVTWASVFPLDVIKTRVQTWDLISASGPSATQPLLAGTSHSDGEKALCPGTVHIARQAYRESGISVFFRGLGICSARAFIVNAVQWAVYEWMMSVLHS